MYDHLLGKVLDAQEPHISKIFSLTLPWTIRIYPHRFIMGIQSIFKTIKAILTREYYNHGWGMSYSTRWCTAKKNNMLICPIRLTIWTFWMFSSYSLSLACSKGRKASLQLYTCRGLFFILNFYWETGSILKPHQDEGLLHGYAPTYQFFVEIFGDGSTKLLK